MQEDEEQKQNYLSENERTLLMAAESDKEKKRNDIQKCVDRKKIELFI